MKIYSKIYITCIEFRRNLLAAAIFIWNFSVLILRVLISSTDFDYPWAYKKSKIEKILQFSKIVTILDCIWRFPQVFGKSRERI